MKGTAQRVAALAALMALTAVACNGTDVEEPAVEEDATGSVEEQAAGPEPCRDQTPSGQEPNEDLLALLPEPEEVWELLGFTACLRRLANAGSVFDTERAAEVLMELDLTDRFQDGLAHDFDHPQGFSLGGMRAFAVLFDDAAAARKGVRLLREALLESAEEIDEPTEAVREISADGLGKDSFGLRGSFHPQFSGFDVVRYVWIRGDLVLNATGWGPGGEPDSAPQEEMLEIARAMDDRAS